MASTYNCPFCEVAYDGETNLRVHLEVEHRKSELAKFVTDREEREARPRIELAP